MTHSDVIHAALQGAVDDGTFPGAVLAVRLRGRLVYEAAVGRLFVQPLGEPVTTETWYDLASLTKVLATTTALLLLVQRGEVALGDPIQKILPELVGRPCGSATIRQLLTHSSGLPGWRPYFERIAEAESTHPGLIGTAAARQAVLGYIGAEELIYEPTTRSLYSDLGFILLGLAVERVTRQPLDRWCQEQIFEPFHAEALSYLLEGALCSTSHRQGRRGGSPQPRWTPGAGAPSAGKCTMKMPLRWAVSQGMRDYSELLGQSWRLCRLGWMVTAVMGPGWIRSGYESSPSGSRSLSVPVGHWAGTPHRGRPRPEPSFLPTRSAISDIPARRFGSIPSRNWKWSCFRTVCTRRGETKASAHFARRFTIWFIRNAWGVRKTGRGSRSRSLFRPDSGRP